MKLKVSDLQFYNDKIFIWHHKTNYKTIYINYLSRF